MVFQQGDTVNKHRHQKVFKNLALHVFEIDVTGTNAVPHSCTGACNARITLMIVNPIGDCTRRRGILILDRGDIQAQWKNLGKVSFSNGYTILDNDDNETFISLLNPPHFIKLQSTRPINLRKYQVCRYLISKVAYSYIT